MCSSDSQLPIVRELDPGLTPTAAFARLQHRRHLLWLDSASGDLGFSGRYSFLSAEPVDWFAVEAGGDDPWPTLQRWCDRLPDTRADTRADREIPFQGGIAGLIGYEASSWLEAVDPAPLDPLHTPAMAVGLYDWTIAWDHRSDRAWLISQGLAAGDHVNRLRRAIERADEVVGWLADESAATHHSDVPSREAWREAGVALPSSSIAPQFSTPQLGVTSNFSSAGFRAAVAEIVDRIRRGDSFQVNLAQRLLQRATCPSAELYLRLRTANPAPFAGYFDGGEFQVLSSSPEGFLTVRDGIVQTRPIKGTVARTGDPALDQQLARQLASSVKDRAENVMIVDLMRNDLSRVCRDASIRVTKLCELERYQHVQHLVSAIEGRLRDDQSIVDLLRACFPGGSVTGAPKIEAMQTIAELEPNRRGPYCGSLGYLSCGGAADFNILIRTITATEGHWQIPVGGGITARSDAVAEEAETWTKARGMLGATTAERIRAGDSGG